MPPPVWGAEDASVAGKVVVMLVNDPGFHAAQSSRRCALGLEAHLDVLTGAPVETRHRRDRLEHRLGAPDDPDELCCHSTARLGPKLEAVVVRGADSPTDDSHV